MSINTLINSPQAFIAYNAKLYFAKDNDALLKLKMLEDARIMRLISELKNWPGKVLSSHKSAQQPFHKLAFLADIGLSINDNEIYSITKKILEHRDEHGIPQLVMNIGASYGGSGKDVWAWALCDAPTVLYGLIKIGYQNNAIDKDVRYLANLVRENGWGCSVSKELGMWRGPGKKNDPCPYANLIMIKLLLQYKDEYKQEISVGCNSLNTLWENSLNAHPYIFYMGTDFRKLKLPFIWYDILHLVDVLGQAIKTKMNASLEDMIKIIRDKTDHGNICKPESMYRYWKDWDFSQKKIHSEWMEFCIRRIFHRLAKANYV